ncbi:type II secretion system GspH family protein [Patescibacteria group bacterium]|nr:type II secretion system GspH family protein [Patescibacteria group bacterium]
MKKILNPKSYFKSVCRQAGLKSNIFFNVWKKNDGFTLVEMITAVAIFSMVMVVGMGALLNVLNANKQAQAIQTAVNNLNLAIEMMSREIRTGYDYHCGELGDLSITRDCLNGENLIAFESYNGNVNSSNDQIAFKFESGRLYKSVDTGVSFLPLTSEELILEDLYFVVVGSAKGDGVQPKVLITAKGYVGNREKGRTSFNLQTTISQRMIDY